MEKHQAPEANFLTDREAIKTRKDVAVDLATTNTYVPLAVNT